MSSADRRTDPSVAPAEEPGLARRFWRALAVGGSEILLGLVLVAGFSLLVLGILVFSFPRGTGLIDYYDVLVEQQRGDAHLDLGGSGRRGALRFMARVSEVKRKVRQRAATAVAWNDADVGLLLEDGHTLQTLSASRATVSFSRNSTLRLDENSLVVVKRQNERRSGARQASLVILGGAVRGSVVPSDADPVQLEILASGGAARIQPQGKIPAEFRVIANTDESATFSVFSGTAEIAAGERTVVVGANQSITVDPDGPIGAPVNIPDRPRPLSPPEGHTRTYSSITPQVRFSWSVGGPSEAYRLAIARDPQFDDLVYEERVGQTDFVHGNLEEGLYYWRVSALSGATESEPGPVRSLRIVGDREKPPLSVELPEGIVESDQLRIHGFAEPGSEVTVGTQKVAVARTGEFECQVRLRSGINMIVIEAIDAAGNSSYESRYVHAKF